MVRRFRWATTAAAALALAAAAPVSAVEPTVQPYSFEGSGVFQEGCPGGYDVLIEFSGHGRTTFFRDASGQIVRIADWAIGEGTIINSADPTKRNTGSSPNLWEWDLTNMTFTIRGMSNRNVVPGEGRVAQDAGVIVWELNSITFGTDPETGNITWDFEVGDLIHSGGKHPTWLGEGIDWCSIVA
jgi:hypothetical protein